MATAIKVNTQTHLKTKQNTQTNFCSENKGTHFQQVPTLNCSKRIFRFPEGNRQFYQNHNFQPNNRFQSGGGPPGAMQQANYHHRNPYTQQQNGAVNGSAGNGIIVEGPPSQISGDTSPINGIAAATAGVGAVDLYSTNGADDLQQGPPAAQQAAQVYTNLNNTTAYPAAPSPNTGIYSTGQYMVDAGVQNMIGE